MYFRSTALAPFNILYTLKSSVDFVGFLFLVFLIVIIFINKTLFKL